MGQAQLYKADGSVNDIGHKPTYEEMTKAVGGYIEYTKGRDSDGKIVTIVVNEEGLLQGLPPNSRATEMRTRLYGDSYLVGDAIVMHGWR